MSPRPRFVVIFYRAPRRARFFRFHTWELATAAADRFSERLDAAAVIFDTHLRHATIP